MSIEKALKVVTDPKIIQSIIPERWCAYDKTTFKYRGYERAHVASLAGVPWETVRIWQRRSVIPRPLFFVAQKQVWFPNAPNRWVPCYLYDEVVLILKKYVLAQTYTGRWYSSSVESRALHTELEIVRADIIRRLLNA